MKITPRIVENVHPLRSSDRLAAVNRMKVDRILHLDEGFENPEVLPISSPVPGRRKANTDAGAEVVIAAGGVVMALLAYAGRLSTPSGAPFSTAL